MSAGGRFGPDPGSLGFRERARPAAARGDAHRAGSLLFFPPPPVSHELLLELPPHGSACVASYPPSAAAAAFLIHSLPAGVLSAAPSAVSRPSLDAYLIAPFWPQGPFPSLRWMCRAAPRSSSQPISGQLCFSSPSKARGVWRVAVAAILAQGGPRDLESLSKHLTRGTRARRRQPGPPSAIARVASNGGTPPSFHV